MATVTLTRARNLARVRPFARPRWWPSGETIACTALLGLVTLLVVRPLVLLLLASFEVPAVGAAVAYGLDNWRAALTEPGLFNALINTVKVTVVVQAISFPLAILIAWAIARTDIPGGEWLEMLFWISFFLPSLALTSGWILVADPIYGAANQVLKTLGLPSSSALNIYSFWGIVFVQVTGVGLGAKVMLLVPALRSMDTSLEEAARLSGAGMWATLIRIVVPTVTPTALIVLLASMIRSFEAFEVELVLGTPANFSVYSTKIYALLNQSPVNYGAATALCMFVLSAALPLVLFQVWLSRTRSYITVTSHMRTNRTRLGAWRWPVSLLVYGTALLSTAIPVGFMLMGSLMGLFGYFDAAEVWTLRHWGQVLGEARFQRGFVNAAVLGIGTALIAVSLFSVVAYVTVRTRYPARWAFDVLSWVPFTIPGIVLGLAYLLFVLGTPFLLPLYGSMALLIGVSTLAVMTVTMQLVKGCMLQLGFELEEAARTLGATWWSTFRRVVLPLLAPALVVAGVTAFATSVRQVGAIVPLTTSQTEPLAVLQLGYLMGEDRSGASVVGTVIVLLSIGAALVARAVGSRVGMRP